MEFKFTEQTKDKVLNGILVISLGLFLFSFLHSTIPQKVELPPPSRYSDTKLSLVKSQSLPQYTELAPLNLPTSPSASSLPQASKKSTWLAAPYQSQPGASEGQPVLPLTESLPITVPSTPFHDLLHSVPLPEPVNTLLSPITHSLL